MAQTDTLTKEQSADQQCALDHVNNRNDLLIRENELLKQVIVSQAVDIRHLKELKRHGQRLNTDSPWMPHIYTEGDEIEDNLSPDQVKDLLELGAIQVVD
jgi:hypothetical protein